MNKTLWGRITIGAAIGVLIAATAAGPPATAATFTITTGDDVVNGADGVLSFREAIALANVAASPTTIDVGVAGPLTLSNCGVSEDDDDNTAGDLDIMATQPVTLELGGTVIDQLCGGERHIHLLTDAAALTINGGVFTAGSGSFPGGASIFAGEATTLNGTEVNSSGSPGTAAVEVDTAAVLTVVGATIAGNPGDALGNTFGGSLTLTDSTVTNNGGAGVNMTDGHLTVSGSTVTNNGGYGVRTTGQGIGSMSVSDSVISDNDDTGITCSNCGSLTVTNTTVTGNVAGMSGRGGIHVAVDLEPVSAITVTLDTVSVTGNSATLAGGGLAVTATTDNPEAPVPQIQITDSTIAGNTTDDRGGAIFAELGALTITNSTLSGNSSGAGAGSIEALAQPVTLRHATIVDGSGLFTDEIQAPALTGTASIVGALTDETLDCATDAAPTLTLSVTGDTTCGGVVGDPELGPLTDNGGQTHTRLPSATSDAGGLVPAASCTLTVDQRGTSRPQGDACDAGAVEFAELTPTPTPTPTPPVSDCTISGTARADVLFGTNGDDVICGLGGADVIVAGRGADRVLGGPGADVIFGGSGDDQLHGNGGTDILVGEGGQDRADGGPGRDRCIAETRVSC